MAISQMYVLTRDYESENINADSFSKKKYFEKGERIVGEYYYKTNILVSNSYPIPLDCLKVSSPNDYSENNLNNQKKATSLNSPFYSKTEQKNKVKLITLGSGLGAGTGFFLASYFGKNRLVFAGAGMLIGIYIQNFLTNKESMSEIVKRTNGLIPNDSEKQ